MDEPEERLYAWLGNFCGEFARSGLVGLGGHGIALKGSLGIDPLGGMPSSIPELLGAPADVVLDFYRGGKDILKGRVWRGIETMAPMSVGRGMQAWRESREGVTTHGGVPKLMDGQRMQPTLWDTALQMTTFSPAHMAAMKEKKWSQTQLISKYRSMRGDIYNRIRDFYSSSNRTPEAWAEILRDIQEYNSRVIEKGLVRVDGISTITPQSIQTSLRQTR